MSGVNCVELSHFVFILCVLPAPLCVVLMCLELLIFLLTMCTHAINLSWI